MRRNLNRKRNNIKRHTKTYELKHAGRGKYNVLDKNGNKINEDLLSKENATLLAENV